MKRPYYHTWNTQPDDDVFPVAGAEHDEFILEDGRRVYDFLSTSFQANFGHSHSAIQNAISRQLQTMPIASPKAAFDLKTKVAERFNDFIGLPGGMVFFTLSGSESVENALKMARQITGRTVIAARKKSYHGATLGALSVTGDWRNGPHFTLDEHTLRIPEPSADAEGAATRKLIEQSPREIAAIIVETISGTNGVEIPPQSWFDALAAICRDHGIMFIVDEVLCGFGRTNASFAFHDYGVQADFVCTSKAITGGYIPFGAVWTGPAVVKYYSREKLACGLTNYAHPLGLAALDVVMDLLTDESFCKNRGALERTFESQLGRIRALECVEEIRCRGLLAAIDLNRPSPTWHQLLEQGIHAFSKEKMIVLAPPLVSEPARLEGACQSLHRSLQENTV